MGFGFGGFRAYIGPRSSNTPGGASSLGKETALSPTDESSGLDKELLAIHNFTQGLYSANAWFLDPDQSRSFGRIWV